jgi:flagellar FliL protein
MAKGKEAAQKPEKQEKTEKTGKSKNKIFLIGVPVLFILIFAGAAGAYFLGVFNSGESSGTAEAAAKTEKEKKLGPLLEMEDFVVNIMHKDTARFLKVGITLEAKDEESREAVKRRMPQITDAVLLMVGNREFDEIKDLQGKMQLKADLLARIQELSGRGSVENLYFTDFVVQ